VRGGDHRALQAAVDYVAELGGGTVHIGPGRYQMRNALKLRDKVNVIGVPGETILEACDGATSPLAMDGDANERQITVEDASSFRVGDGVAIEDRDASGFAVTTATLIARIGTNSFKLSEPLYLDYMVSRQAAAKLAFPVVAAWRAKNVVIEGLTIDGNRTAAQHLNGCRGGGIYLFECEHVTIRNCTVRDYRGDGISFQVSQYVTLEDCLSQNNDGLGIHPGSGSQHPIVRRCRSLGNTSDGLYVCWRVKHGLFEDNEIRGNLHAGISIGHKDTDNTFRRNTVVENSVCGVLFRNEAEAMGAHRNRFESNRILDNGNGAENGAMGAAIVIQGHHHDLSFQNNTIGNTHSNGKSTIGILAGEHTRNLDAERNEFLNVTRPIE
jgi:parallel beta-helix repeat protein